MPAGVLPGDFNFRSAVGGVSATTDSASSIRPFQYHTTTRGMTVHIVGDSVSISTAPVVFNLTLTVADTEYSQALTANAKDFRFRCRTLFDVRYAWVAGKVAAPTAPYLTLPTGSDYQSDSNNLSSQTLYLASSEAGVVVEIEVWS
ncbi:MAG TPA: hypothetical protein ENI23_01040 [bacterium]|nr:hypothetical protein [bacterium]